MKNLFPVLLFAFVSFIAIPFFVSAFYEAPAPVTLKVVSNVTSNTGSLISVSIGGYPTNTSISYWKLNIGCGNSNGVSVLNYSGANVCGTDIRYDEYNTNSTSDYTIITSFGLRNDSTSQQVVQLTLEAFDGSNNTMGADSKVITLGANVQIPTISASTISYIGPSTAKVGDTVYVYGSNFDSYTYVAIDIGSVSSSAVATNYISPTSVSFVIPSNISLGSHTIQVSKTTGNSPLSSTVTFNVVATLQAPVISYITPTTSSSGNTVYVYGNNFNSYDFVYLDGASGPTMATNYVSPTQLSFVLPSSINLGYHNVYVAEKASSFPMGSPVGLNVVSATTQTSTLTITTSSLLPNAKVEQSYLATINTSGIDPSNGYNWSVDNNFPKIGFSFGPSYGNSINITGIPHLSPQQVPQTFAFNVSVNSGSQTATKQFIITVDPATTQTTTVTPTVPTTYTNDAQKQEMIKQLQTLLVQLIQQLIALLQQQGATN